jgi:hypothetical protein
MVRSEKLKEKMREALTPLHLPIYTNRWLYEREFYLPRITFNVSDIPSGLYLIIYKDGIWTRGWGGMSVAYENQGIVYEAEITGVKGFTKILPLSSFDVYYFVVFPKPEDDYYDYYDVISMDLFPEPFQEPSQRVYNSCGAYAKCMPQDVFRAIWHVFREDVIGTVEHVFRELKRYVD